MRRRYNPSDPQSVLLTVKRRKESMSSTIRLYIPTAVFPQPPSLWISFP